MNLESTFNHSLNARPSPVKLDCAIRASTGEEANQVRKDRNQFISRSDRSNRSVQNGISAGRNRCDVIHGRDRRFVEANHRSTPHLKARTGFRMRNAETIRESWRFGNLRELSLTAVSFKACEFNFHAVSGLDLVCVKRIA